MKTIKLTLLYDQSLNDELKKDYPWVHDYRIVSKSLDARKAPQGKKPRVHYELICITEGEAFPETTEPLPKLNLSSPERPIIIGSGPAGIFCALRLAEQGIKSVILERGERTQERMKKIAGYWRYGKLDKESNVCYGEGGAGLYSDGKLITRVKSSLIPYVMEKFVFFGAPPETAYTANPHLGSNKIRTIIGKMTQYLTDAGHELRFNTRVEKLLLGNDGSVTGVELSTGEKITSNYVVLAAGHSAKEIVRAIHGQGVAMQVKDFAVGVRIEHSRNVLDKMQYGNFASTTLGAARYRLSFHDHHTKRGTYSFCMCPGGYVLASSTDAEGLVTNGMSNFSCDSPWSNAGLVVSVKAQEDCPEKEFGALAGLHFLEDIEHKAFLASQKYGTGKELPAMTVHEFLTNRLTTDPLPKTSSPSHLVKVDLKTILPDFVCEHLERSLHEFNRLIPGFSESGILIAPETRTSSPVTILRSKDTLESLSHPGLYPTGEGAGYAGGITSAAVDGIEVACKIIERMQKK